MLNTSEGQYFAKSQLTKTAYLNESKKNEESTAVKYKYVAICKESDNFDCALVSIKFKSQGGSTTKSIILLIKERNNRTQLYNNIYGHTYIYV